MAWLVAVGCEGEPSVVRHAIGRAEPVVVVSGAGADVVADTGADVVADAGPENDVPVSETVAETSVDTSEDVAAPPSLPLVHDGDTRTASYDAWDSYACAPDTDESGREDRFTLTIERMGILRVSVDDVSGDDVDVDVHLLAGADPSTCVARDNKMLAWVVRPGTWTVVVDTWNGDAQAGPYHLEVDLLPLDSGTCTNDDSPMRMFWSACASGIDCQDDGTTRRLATPSFGPVVGEAHLVTVDEGFPGDGWPSALRDQIERHYTISQAATGYLMTRDEPWAPEGEGGSHWGGGATGQKLPVLDEAWYVNMYWRDRPARGRRMLVVEPWSGRAVVAAGGWETGPGSNTAIGGAAEEVHHHLGSSHRDKLVMGFLSDDTLPLGPITCWP